VSDSRFRRALWNACWLLLYRPSPTPFHFWRRFLLRLFGAKIGNGAHPYPSARIWNPRHLEMGDRSCLGRHVDCYCVDRVTIGADAVISQYSYLCTASHDHRDKAFPLVSAPIYIGKNAWIAADVFVGPGVTIGEGAVIGARSTVFQAFIPPWTVSFGNPAVVRDKRHQS
jgi:putative colanic acid biosynthesis acetyltransferase WcaF